MNFEDKTKLLRYLEILEPCLTEANDVGLNRPMMQYLITLVEIDLQEYSE